jgi:hypothetical protein
MRTIEEEIIHKLRTGPCRFDDVVNELPDFSWAEVLDAVDSMSRDGRISLRQHGYPPISYHSAHCSRTQAPVPRAEVEPE